MPARMLTFMGAPVEGIALRVALVADTTLSLRIRGTVPGLPARLEPRPVDTMSRGLDVTALQRTLAFPP